MVQLRMPKSRFRGRLWNPSVALPFLPFLCVVIAIQVFYTFLDALTPPKFVPKPKKYIIPTESSPMPPSHFYDSPYTGFTRAYPTFRGDLCGDAPFLGPTEMGLRTATSRGLLYVKELKTGSTTLSGVTARIARRLAQNKLKSDSSILSANATVAREDLACNCRLVHIRARRFRQRDPESSFLWSVVREPTARMISQFFHFAVGREGQPPTAAAFRKYVEDNEVTDFAYYFKTLTQRPKINPYRFEMYEQFTTEILEKYDFIGISERMDESLVVLQLLLGLETKDILYLSAKSTGTYDFYPSKQKCIGIPKAVVDMAMKEHLYTKDMDNFFAGDVLLYKAANASLDRTIDALGRQRVQSALQRFQWAQHKVHEQCAPSTRYPCSSTGDHQSVNDCLFQDVACGYKCLDRVGDSLATSVEFQKLLAS